MRQSALLGPPELTYLVGMCATDPAGAAEADLLREQLEYYNERAPEYDEMVGEIERSAAPR